MARLSEADSLTERAECTVVSKGWSRNNQQRPPKPPRAIGAGRGGTSASGDLPVTRSWARSRDISDDDKTMTLKWGDLSFCLKLTHAAENPLLGHLSVQLVPYEDSIHPIDLRFSPPLIECGSNRRAFEYQWEKLTYAFGLPDPASFPKLDVDPADRPVLTRFAEVGRRLAGYSAINGTGGLTIELTEEGTGIVRAEHPSDEAFAGTSVSFRQLHNPGEEASYDKVKGILFRR